MMAPLNGQVPTSQLVTVAGVRLEASTGAAFQRAITDAKAQGYLVRPALPLGGYRDLAEQAALKADPSKYGSSLPSNSIAAPGASTHGDGTCVDVLVGLDWFAPRASSYGFARESPSGETNHFRYLHPTFADTSTLGGFLMALTDAQQQKLYDSIVDPTYGSKIDALNNSIGAIATGGILYPGAQYNAFQALSNGQAAIIAAIGKINGGQPADVDEAALAAVLAPALATALAPNLGHLDDATIAKLSAAVADEQAKRLAN